MQQQRSTAAELVGVSNHTATKANVPTSQGASGRVPCWAGGGSNRIMQRPQQHSSNVPPPSDTQRPAVDRPQPQPQQPHQSGGRLPKGSIRMSSSYDLGRLLGNGSFGIVCEARCLDTGEQVAVKKVLQDPRYKNRELDVMKELAHPNIVELKDYFYTESPSSGEGNHDPQRFLNVVMEHVPDTVYRVLKTFVRNNQPLPMLLVRLYTYQLCRSLGYLHSLGICHRDIKPQNLLVDSRTHVLKLCDFGSAKRLVRSEHSVAYICSRFYRAPELMLGATEYSTAIDLWSIGCVLGELLLGRPLFSGETSVDQLVKIIQVLGTPNQRQMQAMNPNYQEFRFPDVRPRSWKQVMSSAVGGGTHIPDEALNLLDLLLKYEPEGRIGAYEALAHAFFDPLRDPNCRLPEGSKLPELFNFSAHELQCMSPACRETVVPNWYRSQLTDSSSVLNTTTQQPASVMAFTYPSPLTTSVVLPSSAPPPQQYTEYNSDMYLANQQSTEAAGYQTFWK